MQNVKNTIVDKMLSFLAPHLCCGCGEIDRNLCDSCRYDIISESYGVCIDCGRPEPRGICPDHGTSFDRAWIVGERKDVLQRLIGLFKFKNVKTAAGALADLLDARLPTLPSRTVLVPIPTAPSHIRERGYDHLELIARHLSARRNIIIRHVLRRNDDSTQHHANRETRFEQVKTAFVIEGEVDVDVDAIYVIVDDIITTGATIHRAADLLRAAGASTIWVAAIARQPSTDPLTSVKITQSLTKTMER